MFEESKKAALNAKRLIAVAAVPALFILVLSLLCRFAPIGAGAMYVVSNDGPVHVDDLAGDVFLTDGSAGLVSRTSGNELALTPGLNVTVTNQDQQYATISQEETLDQLLERLGILLSPLEMASVSFPDGGVDVCISGEFVFYEHISTKSEAKRS